MNNKINFIVSKINSLASSSQEKRSYYYDEKVAGLGIMVFPSGTKTFFLYKRVNGIPAKIKLGRFPEMSIEQARKAAYLALGDISEGINPNHKKQKLRNETTFADLFDKYLKEYAKQRKKSWDGDLGYYERYLRVLDNKKLSMFSRSDIEKIHNNIKTQVGLDAANRVLSLIKTIFNKAIDWGYEGNNPAAQIRKFPEKSRDRALQPHEISSFFEALNNETHYLLRCYFYLSLLTGARKRNLLEMRWEHIVFGEVAEWKIPVTKNGESQTIMLVPQAIEILNDLKKNSKSEWVFPSPASSSGHLEEPKTAWKRILTRASIKDLRIHDLRRTLASWLVRTGANSFIIGKTLGHKSQHATAVYARVSEDVTRVSMKNAVNAMFEYKKG